MSALTSRVQILDQAGIQARLRRMAYEIYEAHYDVQRLIVIGIDVRGGFLAHRLVEQLREISALEVELVPAYLDRDSDPPGIGIELQAGVEDLQGQRLLVVDDVLYTGTTLLHVVSILLHAQPASIQTAILIDRGHRLLPVSSDVVGLQLATTLQQHVEVEIDPEGSVTGAFLR